MIKLLFISKPALSMNCESFTAFSTLAPFGITYGKNVLSAKGKKALKCVSDFNGTGSDEPYQAGTHRTGCGAVKKGRRNPGALDLPA